MVFQIFAFPQLFNQGFLRKMLGTWYGPVGTRFSIVGTRIGSLKHLEKTD